MPRIRQWTNNGNVSTSRAQFAPNQTRFTGQRRAFLQRYQPAKTGAQEANEVAQERQYQDNKAGLVDQLVVGALQTGARYGLAKYQAKKDAAKQAYKAETDALLDEAKSSYANEAAKVSAEQKFRPIQSTDENGNSVFASDEIENNYTELTSPLAEQAQTQFAGRADSDRALQDFNAWRESIDLSHKKKLYNEGAAMAFKHAQERTTMTAMAANSEYELERILKTASENEIFSSQDLHSLKMEATEKIHTNRFSGVIDQLGGDMVNMSDEQFDMVRDDLVGQLWNDNDALIITNSNRNSMINKLQALDSSRQDQIETFNKSQYLGAMQQYAESGGNKAVLAAALGGDAGERFGHENSLKMINLLMKESGNGSSNKVQYKNLMAAKTLDYQSGSISEQEYVSWALENQQNIGDISGVFKSIGSERTNQQRLDIKAVKDQLSLYATGMRSDEMDFSGQVKVEMKADRDKMLTDLSAFIAENPNGDVRRWSMARLANAPVAPEAQAINGVGENLADTDWNKLEADTRTIIITKENEFKRIMQSGEYGEQGGVLQNQIKELKKEYVLIKRYANSWRELNKPENRELLKSVLSEGSGDE